jgi:hypothetical protein
MSQVGLAGYWAGHRKAVGSVSWLVGFICLVMTQKYALLQCTNIEPAFGGASDMNGFPEDGFAGGVH